MHATVMHGHFLDPLLCPMQDGVHWTLRCKLDLLHNIDFQIAAEPTPAVPLQLRIRSCKVESVMSKFHLLNQASCLKRRMSASWHEGYLLHGVECPPHVVDHLWSCNLYIMRVATRISMLRNILMIF